MSQQDAVFGERSRRLESMPEDWQRALAVVAHPDDLEYGAAAAVAEWTAGGREVSYLLVTRGEAGIDTLEPSECSRVREEEQRASAAVVGVQDLIFLTYPDGVITDSISLRRDIAAAVRSRRPELVITLNHHDTFEGGFWNTPDHRAVGRATLDAVGDAGNRWIFTDQLTEDGLEPWQGVRWVAVAASPESTHVVTVTEDSAERAVASLAEHRAYLAALSDQEPAAYARSFLLPAMEEAGERSGGGRAVAFQVYAR